MTAQEAWPTNRLLRPCGWVAAGLVERDLPGGGHGLFAERIFMPGELLVVWGGDVVGRDGLEALRRAGHTYSVQIEEDLYLVSPPGQREPADCVNHCCTPNAALSGQVALTALTTIRPGEQVRYDYGTSDGSDYDEFDCRCGAIDCRGRVTGDDWRDPVLQQRFAGVFSPYIARRIAELSRSVAC